MLYRRLSLLRSGNRWAFETYVGRKLCIVVIMGWVICTAFNARVRIFIEGRKDCFFTYRFFCIGRSGGMSFSAVNCDMSWLSGDLFILWYRVLHLVILFRRRAGRFCSVALHVLACCRCMGLQLTGSAWSVTPVRID